MTVFDEIKYVASTHILENRVADRLPGSNERAASIAEQLTSEGEVLIEIAEGGEVFRYVRNGSYFFPCVREKDEYTFKIITCLTWDMVERGELEGSGLQFQIDKHHSS